MVAARVPPLAYPNGAINWQDPVVGSASGSTVGVELGNVVALSTGYGTTAATYAAVTITATSITFTVDFIVHDYYANCDLKIDVNGQSVTPETIPNRVPETGSLALGMLGAALLVFWRRRH